MNCHMKVTHSPLSAILLTMIVDFHMRPEDSSAKREKVEQMKRFMLGVAALAVVSACSGGNPFLEDGGTGGGDSGTPSGIPEDLQGSLTSVTYTPPSGGNPGTLVVRGQEQDGTPFERVYNRRVALDRGGYEAYTAQETSLTRHNTAYVKDINGTRGTIVVSGGQFGYYFGGSTYSRSGGFTPPNSGAVTYSGNYVGLMNYGGSGEDLLPVPGGTPPEVRPRQAAEVTGRAIINADFIDNNVNGLVIERNAADLGQTFDDLELSPTSIASDGTFTDDVTIGNIGVGTYGGIFGGPNGSTVAGTLYVTDFEDAIDDEEEYGLFVLGQCGTPDADASLCP